MCITPYKYFSIFWQMCKFVALIIDRFPFRDAVHIFLFLLRFLLDKCGSYTILLGIITMIGINFRDFMFDLTNSNFPIFQSGVHNHLGRSKTRIFWQLFYPPIFTHQLTNVMVADTFANINPEQKFWFLWTF